MGKKNLADFMFFSSLIGRKDLGDATGGPQVVAGRRARSGGPNVPMHGENLIRRDKDHMRWQNFLVALKDVRKHYQSHKNYFKIILFYSLIVKKKYLRNSG